MTLKRKGGQLHVCKEHKKADGCIDCRHAASKISGC